MRFHPPDSRSILRFHKKWQRCERRADGVQNGTDAERRAVIRAKRFAEGRSESAPMQKRRRNRQGKTERQGLSLGE